MYARANYVHNIYVLMIDNGWFHSINDWGENLLSNYKLFYHSRGYLYIIIYILYIQYRI